MAQEDSFEDGSWPKKMVLRKGAERAYVDELFEEGSWGKWGKTPVSLAAVTVF